MATFQNQYLLSRFMLGSYRKQAVGFRVTRSSKKSPALLTGSEVSVLVCR